MNKLFKVTAHHGKSFTIYFVVAKDPTAAEQLVENHRSDCNEFHDIYCNIECVAQEDRYGLPYTLLL